ncbi:MAG TPA: cupin domain-containing protein [Rubrobacteraceae bacterium]|nr:cupin domain-containing protein [Rubrobacteraceae bacterium]
MAHAGEVIENPVTGERVVFRQTAGDKGGELLQFDHYLKVNGIGPYEHFHPRQHERFRVVSGTMGVRLDGREHVLRAEEEITIPPGAKHTWWNAGEEELHQITEFRPALKFEVFTSTLYALGREEHTYKGFPAAAQFAVLAVECKDNVYLARYPLPLQKAVYRLLMPAARLLGYHARYRRHSI